MQRKLLSLVALGIAASCSGTLAMGQESLVGKYSGNFQAPGGSDVRVALNINSVADGVVKGTFERRVSSRRGGACDGEFPVAGTYKDNKLDVRTIEKVGKAEDCTYRLRMNVQGDKLVGNMGKTELTLSK